MKRMTGILCLLLIIVVVIIDLKSDNRSISKNTHVLIVPYATKEVVVRDGETVFSIMEDLHADNPLEPELEVLFQNFKMLNPHVNPYELMLEETYIFPIYK